MGQNTLLVFLLCLASDTGYSLNSSANISPINMIFYLEQAGRTPHFSTDLEEIAISHTFPLMVLI